MQIVFGTPSPAELVPSPYKQGESAVRYFFLHNFSQSIYSIKTSALPDPTP